jgi:PhoPQ-activated pathogenicity-related protein
LIIIGTNDHYWPLDALNLYWQDLQGPKHILYVPNNRHGLKDLGRVFGSLHALHRQAVDGQPLPQLTWQLKQDARGVQLEVRSDIRPDQVQAWVATSPTREFREARFRSVTLQRAGESYRYQRPRPAEGYLALFGEALYGRDAVPSFFSTNVQIVAAQQAASETP